jgi:UDP-N-acetylglucosamine 2-epimerase (non-hydrolysing)
MAPVYAALRADPALEPLILLSGQHREQLLQGMDAFGLPAAANLDLMTPRQTLPELAGRVVPQAAQALRALGAEYVLVHGDTLTTFAVAWAAFLEQIPFGHVEAGLRSFNLSEPFPEEANRRLTTVLSDLDFAPTPLARSRLLAEGKPAERVLVTGQTAVDAVLQVAAGLERPQRYGPGRLVTLTIHRRENWGRLPQLAAALAEVALRHPQWTFVYPVHLNPAVREAVWGPLSAVPNVTLLDPLGYRDMVALLASSQLIVTDSGGLQEEGAALGVPVLVLRNVTERPEGLASGVLRLAGNDPEQVSRLLDQLLSDPEARGKMASAPNPYGDGRAGLRVAQGVAWRLGLAERPEDWQPPA